MASVVLYLDTREKEKKGLGLETRGKKKYPLKYLISHKGRTAMIHTSLHAYPEEWEDGKFTSVKQDYKKMNLSLERVLLDLKSFINTLETTGRIRLMSATDIKYAYGNSKKEIFSQTTFTGYLEEYKNRFEKDTSREKYQTTQSRIKDFAKGKTLLFEDITYEWLVKFDLFLSKNGTPSINGRRPILSCIRSAFNAAKKEKIISKDIYPFDEFQIKSEKTRKRNISVEDLRNIKDLDTDDEMIKIARDYFMLCFYLIGINPVDLYGLEYIENGRVYYKREKNGRLYSVEVLPPALKIINANKGKAKLLSWCERYKNYDTFYCMMNEALHRLRDRVGIPELTQYWCRHSWATIAHKIGISKDVIGAALGHSEEGDDVTWIYIEFDQDKVDDANRRVVNFVTKPTKKGKVIEMKKVV